MAEFGCVDKIAAFVTANHTCLLALVGSSSGTTPTNSGYYNQNSGTGDMVCGQKYPDSGQQK